MRQDYPFLIRNAGDDAFIAHVRDLIGANLDRFRPNTFDPERRRFWTFTHDVDRMLTDKKHELIERLGIVDWIEDPNFHDFIGMISDGGTVHPHTDPNNEGRMHARINLLVRAPERGCIPLLDTIPIDVQVGDAWLCFSGHCRHATTPVEGKTSRSALSYGLQVDRRSAFPLYAKYLSWKSAVLGNSPSTSPYGSSPRSTGMS